MSDQSSVDLDAIRRRVHFGMPYYWQSDVTTLLAEVDRLTRALEASESNLRALVTAARARAALGIVAEPSRCLSRGVVLRCPCGATIGPTDHRRAAVSDESRGAAMTSEVLKRLALAWEVAVASGLATTPEQCREVANALSEAASEVSRLTRALEEVQQERDMLADRHGTLQGVAVLRLQRAEQAEADAALARTALEQYGQHKDGCGYMLTGGQLVHNSMLAAEGKPPRHVTQCTCGLAALTGQARQTTGE